MVFSAEEKRERHRLAVQRNRARESPEQRAKRLQRQRERQVRARTAVGHNEVCQSIDEPHRSWLDGGVPTLRPVSNSTKEEVLHRLRLDLGPPGLDDATCAVCDCSKLRKSMTMVSVSDDQARIEQMQVLLSSTDEQLPPQLIAEYDCSNRFACLDGLLLSKSGIHSGGYIQVCDDCNISLTKQLLPKFAIKNGFYVGSLPSHLASATLPERLMTQTVSIVAVTRVMRGGAHRAIRSHCLAFDSMPGPAVTLLPTSVRGVSCYRVVMAGPFTTEQQARIRQMHLVRRQVVEDLLAFYCEHNALYEDVVVNCSSLAPETVADHLISEEINVDINVNDIDAESDRVGSTAEIGVTDGETDVVEHSVVFIVDDREVITQGKPPSPIQVVELPTQHTPQPQFLVRRSTRFAGKKNSLFARMFPHLFPYGRGDPNEQRQIPVSLEACIRHYSQLSTRRFAEDELFTLVSFDHLTLQRMYLHVALNCQRDPARFERYAAISEASLIEALQKKELRRQGRATATHDNSSSDSDFLKTVELSSGVVWGSDAERAQCRRRAFAYQARYGQPALFVTLTPNVGDSFVMAHYTGVSSVDTLFDANLAQLPRRSALHGASLRNDVASARLFMHNMDAFIEHVLGISPKKMKTKAFDGLFGDVKAYFGVVETQGGGTLHAHFLVWLADAPPNTDAFNRATAELGDQYNSDIATYTDSIVSTSLPLDAAVNCQFCGHSLSDLVALPIPPEAYESPNDGRGSARTEPLLVQCTQCATKMSSQHVLRRAILQQRPPTWPPPLRTYSSEELNAAVQMEVNCRGSVGAAKTAVFRRDMILATRDSVDDTYGEYLRTLNSMPYRSEQREDDAFRDDKVAQAIITLPPSVDDERWPPNATAFAVSMLVFMLNLHWWSHVGSCFKASRMSAPGQCRYRFPRVRVASTSCTSAGVELARRPPFEYVNGFNATMMLAFKSNHDVQVLIGGLEALLRIYYATKYVTKMQNVVDSVTAVALAAFKRRELREQQNQTPHSDRSALGRTRVASMAFALTNQREIAGPLAALYLLRGSCAYMSTTCTSLPLYDVLRELIQRDTHSCNLVELQEGGSSVTFRAASFLDDYTFRPLKLDRMNLYEFVMACFRRKQSKATATSDLFLPGHPLQSTHCIGHHQVEAVPVITGVRMPYVDSKTPSNLVVKRAQCALALFKPFRTVLDLVNDPASESAWIDAYLEWESTRTNFVHEIMANMDDYYHASKLAQEDEGTGSNELVHEADSDELVGTRSDIECAMGNMSNDSQTTDGGSIDDFCHVFAEDDAGAVDTDGGGSLPIFPTRGTGSLLSSIVHQELLGPTAESTAHAAINLANDEHELGLSVTGLREWVKDPTSDEAEPSLTDHPREERPSDVLELIQSALESDQEWPSPNQQHGCPTSSPLRPYPSINDVSTTFTLNHRQHVAFSLIARALLRRFQQQELANAHKSSGYSACDFESRLRDDQLLMFLGGAGGTGKSRVVDAVNAFCSGWHRDSSFVKAALTGKAATLIGGRTLASFLVRLEHAIKTKKFAPLDLLVIDEVSMMSKVEWVKLDKLLRRYMQIQNVPFGGIHVVLVGDFLQMPPVRSDPIYLDPIGKAKPSTVDVGGFELWRRFTVVVILDECVRFRGDPEWGEGCRNARLGRWTPEFIDMINTQVVQATRDGDNAQHLQDQAVASVVFVTPENSTRLAINNAFMKETAAKLPNDVYPIRVVANFKGALNGLSRSDLCYVLSLPDNRFGRMAPFLDLVQGMPIQVTQNVATAKGVANGTLGILEYVHFPAGTHFRLVRDGATSTVVQLPSRPPDYALIRVPRPHAASIRPGMDPELFPVFYATEAYTKATIRLTPAPDGQPRYVKVRPQQFPFVCAVGSTVYKVQGETLQSMIVMDWKSTQPLVNKPEQTYLLVSRVTTRNGLTALSPLTPKLVEWSKPSDHALHEEERLHGLCNATLTEFHLPVTTDVTGRCRDGNDYQSRN